MIGVVLSAYADLFKELLFGEGAWLGLILILMLILILVTVVKYSSLITFPILVFLGIMYLNNVPANSYFMYSALITWACIPLTFFIEAKRQ